MKPYPPDYPGQYQEIYRAKCSALESKAWAYQRNADPNPQKVRDLWAKALRARFRLLGLTKAKELRRQIDIAGHMPKKLKRPYIEPNFPTWALSYLINGDATGFDYNPETAEENQAMVDNWAKENPGIHDFKQEDPHFSWRPAFGLACECVELTTYPMEEQA